MASQDLARIIEAGVSVIIEVANQDTKLHPPDLLPYGDFFNDWVCSTSTDWSTPVNHSIERDDNLSWLK